MSQHCSELADTNRFKHQFLLKSLIKPTNDMLPHTNH